MRSKTARHARLLLLLVVLWQPVEAGAESPSTVREATRAARFTVPEWTADTVWYQVFVTRFRNGEPANDPPGTVAWDEDWTRSGGDDRVALRTQLLFRSYGGDLQGLRGRLDYLASLGVNALYLNPIFDAPSQHKYDTADHRHIDDSLAITGSADRLAGETADPASWTWSASDRYFLALLDEAHARGMRIVLDGVFNHVGRDFWAFRDVVQRGRASAYADWFDVIDWGPPLHYRAWDRPDGHLPRFRRAGDGLQPDVEHYLFAVVRRWMDPNGDGDPSDGIDGWRLDAAERVPHGFWRRFRAVAKSINPDAVILGEIWTDATDWLGGDEFDTVTNYRFSQPVIEFLRRGADRDAPTKLTDALVKLQDRHPAPVNRAMMNLLGSHDTERTVSMLLDPTRYPGDATLPVPERDLLVPTEEDYRRLSLAVVLQFTWVGAPLIYYGDELGMYGGDDPFCRAPMRWSRIDAGDDRHGLPALYRVLSQLRRDRVELRRGQCRVLLADDARGLLVFERVLGDRCTVVLINSREDTQEVHLPSSVAPDWASVRIPCATEPLARVERSALRFSADGRLPLRLSGLEAVVLTSPRGD